MTTPTPPPPPARDWQGFRMPAPPIAARSGPFESLRSPAAWTMGLLAASCVASAALAVVEVANALLLQRVIDGAALTAEVRTASMLRYAATSVALLLLLLPTGIVFAVWFHRAYANLPALGSSRRFGAGWAVGGWLVPVLNLVRPKQIADEIWLGSHATRSSAEERTGLMTVHVWWALWLFSGVIWWTASLSRGSGDLASAADLGEIQVGAAMNGLAGATTTGAGVVALLIVRRLTALQEQEAARRGGYGLTPPIVGRGPLVLLVVGTAVALSLALWASRPSALSEDFIRALAPADDDVSDAGSARTPAAALDAPAQERVVEPAREREPAAPEEPVEAPRETVWVDELGVGDCFDEDADEEWTPEVFPVPCAHPHLNEVFALVDLEYGDDAPYPGDEQLDQDGQDACVEPFERYVGLRYEQSRLWLWAVYPGPDEWRKGDREVICVLDGDGELLEGSMAGARE